MQKVTILGATGSIGQSTIDVIKSNSSLYEIYALVAGSNVKKMLELVCSCRPKFAALFDKAGALALKKEVKALGLGTEVLGGEEEILTLCEKREVDYVVGAIVGAAGLKPALSALKASRTLLLANKESLVMSGKIFFDTAEKYNARVLPLDSEHSAIFQSMPAELGESLGFCDLKAFGVDKILLTGSGGPFRNMPLSELGSVTSELAINHPVWSMGPKISVDSSTMMNKGLEFIEAKYLFNASSSDIEVIIHPQSVIHSMVSYIDGAVIAQLGNPDMKTPIARALAYPKRIVSGVKALDFTKLKSLDFFEPDFKRYPCLKLAIDASASGQAATTALNAANEAAVTGFLEGRIGYLDIFKVCSQAVDKFLTFDTSGIDEILDLDARVRDYATKVMSNV